MRDLAKYSLEQSIFSKGFSGYFLSTINENSANDAFEHF